MTGECKNWKQLLPKTITVFECNVNKHHNYYNGKTLLFAGLFSKEFSAAILNV